MDTPKIEEATTLKYANGFRRRLQLVAQVEKRKEAQIARMAVEAYVEEWERNHPEMVAAAKDLWAAMEKKAA